MECSDLTSMYPFAIYIYIYIYIYMAIYPKTLTLEKQEMAIIQDGTVWEICKVSFLLQTCSSLDAYGTVICRKTTTESPMTMNLCPY